MPNTKSKQLIGAKAPRILDQPEIRLHWADSAAQRGPGQLHCHVQLRDEDGKQAPPYRVVERGDEKIQESVTDFVLVDELGQDLVTEADVGRRKIDVLLDVLGEAVDTAEANACEEV